MLTMVDTQCDAMEIECLQKLSPSIRKVMGSHLNPRPFAEYTVDLTQAPERVK